jgi:hypothetical protein
MINSCNNDNTLSLFTRNQSSIIPILPTKHQYRGLTIFKIGIDSNYLKYRGYLNEGFFFVKKNTIYGISLQNDCFIDYKTGNYSINNRDDSKENNHAKSKNIVCDILIRQYFSTNVRINDTISMLTSDFEWTILKAKFFDTAISDTVFIYERKTNMTDYLGFSFSYSIGFMGLYKIQKDMNDNIVLLENAYGEIYEDTLKTMYPKVLIKYAISFNPIFKQVDLSTIKEFKKQ